MMSETIPRNSPEVRLKNHDEQLTCTYENTSLFFFDPQYEAMNHIFVRDLIHGGGTYIFNVPEQMAALWEMRYTAVHAVYPSDEDVIAYETWQSQVLDRELQGLDDEPQI